MRPLTVAIGYDSKEIVAYHVCAHSILARASIPVAIVPIKLDLLRDVHDRPKTPNASTEFTISRFLTPYLAGTGPSVFMDCDFLIRGDIAELYEIALANMQEDVLVVKHNYVPRASQKFLGQTQTTYPRKNWSSLMVFNGHRCAVRALTPEYVNAASPMDLHQFKWARSIGELPSTWNHLVGEYEPDSTAKGVHFTLGGPWFGEYRDCEFADEWRREYAALSSVGRIG